MRSLLNNLTFIRFDALALGALCVLAMGASGCAYRFGYEGRDLPEGFKAVSIPVFKNKTQEVSIERFFTNELVQQFNRSKVAKVVADSTAPATVEGTIDKVEYLHGGQVVAEKANASDNKFELPSNSVLTTEYRVLVKATIVLRRKADQKIVWQGAFDSESVYTAPQIGLQVVNSANALYNHSARMEVIERMSRDMMAEAHDRMTENF